MEDDNVSFLTEAEFVGEYGKPPWDFVNDILQTANLDFRINLAAQEWRGTSARM